MDRIFEQVKMRGFAKTLAFLLVVEVALIGGLPVCSYAQQHSLFTQYMFNSLALNPAYAGYAVGGSSLDMSLVARVQWIGVEGSPMTQTFSAHAPSKNKRMGLGLQIMHDQLGSTREIAAYASYAYHLAMSSRRFTRGRFSTPSTLSVGIQAGVNHFRNAMSTLTSDAQTSNGQDPVLGSGDINNTVFNLGVGMLFYTDKIYIGLSAPFLLENKYFSTNSATQSRHFFLSSGYLFRLTPSLQLRPTILLKMILGAPFQADVNANLIIKDALWLGISWRILASVNFLAEYQITDRLRVGYAYDLPTTSLLSFTANTHELMVKYRIPLGEIKILNPRCF